eukprot:NODE_1158_length_2585_cov_21.865338.p1 GENE.NODE_1158_length_2585_cov_21.865338~~NODE_1158_length_2585_cov_21.865338.p1  ORF type:complete len:688 (+),score=218.81 NODE_1158_length_2585_cov_21.865338:164-2227(+)
MRHSFSMACCLVLSSLLANVAGAAVSADSATPVDKVVEMLSAMLKNAEQSKSDERTQFMTFKTFCEDTTTQKAKAIALANDKMELLKAEIAKAANDAAVLAFQIAAHTADIAVWQGDQKATTTVRKIDKDSYDALYKDYSESIDAILRAKDVLMKQRYNRPQNHTALMQLSQGSLIPPETRRLLDAYLQREASDDADATVPVANAYEFQSQTIISTLLTLHDKFVAERTQLEKNEHISHHEYNGLIQQLGQQITNARADVARKTAEKGVRLQYKADSAGSLKDTTTTRKDDDKYRTDLIATCEQKAMDYESRRVLRIKEMKAIKQAIEIIKTQVQGHASTYMAALLLQEQACTNTGPIFAQVGAKSNMPQQRAIDYLQKQGVVLDSKLLVSLAQRASADPFVKVKDLIKELIMRLMNEAQAETEHKAWCDKELATNERTRKEKTAGVQGLKAQIDQLTTSIAKLAQDIANLDKAIANLDSALAQATKLREAEKARNAKTISDATDAQTGVASALAVLNEFYSQASSATALAQEDVAAQPTSPAIFSSSYTGMQAQHGGVVGMLEVIQGDFARLQLATEGAEKTAQDAFDKFTNDTAVDRAAKVVDRNHRRAKVEAQTRTLATAQADLLTMQRELTAAIAYFDRLKPACLDSGATYEKRAQRRSEEIASLKQALWILSSNSDTTAAIR